MRNVATHNYRAVERQTCANRIFRQDIAYIAHRLIQVDTYCIALTGIAQLFRNQAAGVVVHTLNPDTVLVDFAFDVTVCRATDAQTDGATCTVAGQADNTHIVSHILAAELCAQTYLVCLLQQLFLQLHIAERTPRLIARSGQAVVVVGRCQFHRQQVLLCTRTANHNRDMIRRTSRRTQTLHLLHKERNQRAGVLDTRFGLLVEIGLVGTAATFRYAQETVFHTLRSLDVYLRRQIAFRVHFFVHRQRSVLRIAQVVLCIGVIDTVAQGFLVAETGPHVLTFLAVDNCRTCILAQGQLTLARHLRIAQESECHIFVVGTGFRVA